MGFYVTLDIECDNKVNKLWVFLKKIGVRDSLVALQSKFNSIPFFFYKNNPNYVSTLQGLTTVARKKCPLAGSEHRQTWW